MKKLIYLVVILLVVGMWMGINFARDKPLFSNPFEEKDIREKAKKTLGGMYEETKQALENKVKQ